MNQKNNNSMTNIAPEDDINCDFWNELKPELNIHQKEIIVISTPHWVRDQEVMFGRTEEE